MGIYIYYVNVGYFVNLLLVVSDCENYFLILCMCVINSTINNLKAMTSNYL